MNLQRFIPDDGLHQFDPILDSREITSNGDPRYIPACSCNWTWADSVVRPEAFLIYRSHALSKLKSDKGPEWLSLESRIAVSVMVMVSLFLLSYFTGYYIAENVNLSKNIQMVVKAFSVLTGFSMAFGFMIATRRFIMPMKG